MLLPVVIPPDGVVNDNTPEPLVCKTCPFVPSALGRLIHTFDAIISAALRITKFVPLSVSSYSLRFAPAAVASNVSFTLPNADGTN
jgi:hypothetical protein